MPPLTDSTGPLYGHLMRVDYYSALLARLERGAEAWQRLEEQSGRGLLDELAARQDKRLTQEERDSLRSS